VKRVEWSSLRRHQLAVRHWDWPSARRWLALFHRDFRRHVAENDQDGVIAAEHKALERFLVYLGGLVRRSVDDTRILDRERMFEGMLTVHLARHRRIFPAGAKNSRRRRAFPGRSAGPTFAFRGAS
jgi:hypothetical protein